MPTSCRPIAASPRCGSKSATYLHTHSNPWDLSLWVTVAHEEHRCGAVTKRGNEAFRPWTHPALGQMLLSKLWRLPLLLHLHLPLHLLRQRRLLLYRHGLLLRLLLLRRVPCRGGHPSWPCRMPSTTEMPNQFAGDFIAFSRHTTTSAGPSVQARA